MSASDETPKGNLPKESGVEQIAGSLPTQMATSVVAALAAGPLVALLPVLTQALASGRQRQRIENALEGINEILQEHSGQLQNISDEQYKLINEAILAVLHTTDPEKLKYLRRAVRNGLTIPDLVPMESAVLSRVVRDISAEEVEFLLTNFGYDRIQLSEREEFEDDKGRKILCVPHDGREALIVGGLIALGLLVPGEATWDDSGRFRFATVVAKLIALLREEPQPVRS